MKIAFVVPSLVNKGPIIVVHNLVTFLKDKVDVIDVYYFDDTPESSMLNFDCKLYKIRKSDKFDFNKYDIIHTHTLRADVYIYRLRKNNTWAKIISTLHQNTFKSFSIRYSKLISLILTNYWLNIQKQFDGIIAISNELNVTFNNKLNNKVTTIYNGCNLESFKTDRNIENLILQYKNQGFKILGSYAYITKGKGISQVLNVLRELPDFVYVIIGEGPFLNELKKIVNQLRLNDRVLFIPYVKAPYLYLKYIDVYMMPSYSEGFGLAMVEAALMKKAIVCSNIPSFNEIFESSEVLFFELDNQKSLINAIQSAFFEREERGNLAYIKANKNFTSKIMAENHLNYYKNILKK